MPAQRQPNTETESSTASGDLSITKTSGPAAPTDATAETVETANAIGTPSRSRVRDLEPGTRVGRYLVVSKIAAGGMGSVYNALDPELDRRVAIKVVSLVHSDGEASASAAARLVREAKAMAQLSHPNVVAVYDVGAFGDDVFIAMELVVGTTLRSWLRDEKRSAGEIVSVFCAAGRGLAAAHDAGIVHRDFKPDNVLVGRDGRVQVVDFGIALAEQADHSDVITGEYSSDTTKESFESVSSRVTDLTGGSASTSARLTQAGALVGTPAYMSPEQFLGRPVDPRGDQFSFCVALFEALHGKRPFKGKRLDDLRQNVLDGRVRPPGRDSRVPQRLHRILERGLSPAPDDRFDSMSELIDELARDPRAAVRKLSVAAALVGFAAVALVASLRSVSAPAAPCDGAGDAARTLWNDDHATAVTGAFSASGRSHGPDTAIRVGRALERRADAWGVMRRQACEATWLHGEQSESLMDLRMRCLDRRRNEQQALVAVFSSDVDAAVVDRAVEATESLPDIALCADTETLDAAYPPPTDSIANEVTALQKQVDELRALVLAGRYSVAADKARATVELARKLGYPPVLAEALFQLAMAVIKVDFKQAEDLLEQTIAAATEANDQRLVAHSASQWMWVVGYEGDRVLEAKATIPLARAAAARVKGDAQVQAGLLNSIGGVEYRLGNQDRTRQLAIQALEILEKEDDPGDILLGKLHNNIGLTSIYLCDLETGIREIRLANELKSRSLGDSHPTTARGLVNLGWALAAKKEYAAALAPARQGLATLEQVFGPKHPKLVSSLTVIADALVNEGDLDGALAAASRALAITESAFAPGHVSIGQAARLVASVHARRERYDESIELYRRAIGIFESRPKELVTALLGLSETLILADQAAAAREHLQRAIDVATKSELDSVPRVRAALAKSLWRSGRQQRARDMAALALEEFKTSNDCEAPAEARALRDWIAARP